MRPTTLVIVSALALGLLAFVPETFAAEMPLTDSSCAAAETAAGRPISVPRAECRLPQGVILSRDQQREFDALQAQFHEQLTFVHWTLEAKRGELKQLAARRAEDRLLNQKRIEIAELEEWIEVRQVKFHLDALALLTPAQAERHALAHLGGERNRTATVTDVDLDTAHCPWIPTPETESSDSRYGIK